MKIRRLIINDIDYKPLMKGVDLFFPKSNDDFIHANCFIGVNGSGKSQVLELIAEIFLFLDKIFREENNKEDKEYSPFAFKIEYEIVIRKKEYLIVIINEKIKAKRKDLYIEILTHENDEIEYNPDNFYKFLPSKIIGYTSGDNETLSLPFDAYYDEYATYTADRAFGKKEGDDYEPILYFMNYNTNLGIAISSLIFEEEITKIRFIKGELKINKLISFKLTIQTKQKNAPNKKRGGVILTNQLELWKTKLINCASKVEYDESTEKYLLDFSIDEVTKKAFKFHFANALELYTCLYKLELLNNLIIGKDIRQKIEKDRKGRKLITKMPMVPESDKVLSYSELKLELVNGCIVDYLSLSDGEHQFLNVFGTILMIDQDNCIFLLDEPETHFNPMWRRTFIDTLKKITKGRKQDMFITTHSPFIISDTKKENVFIFRRNQNKISISEPIQETYGASFDEVLKMAFDLNPPIAAGALSLIKELENSTDIAYIESRINELGESYELNSVYQRIELLKSKSN
ncbi:ABC transporter [Bacteroidia bacterium]|nr:ABC transporter [Bacteroidia bacterium]